MSAFVVPQLVHSSSLSCSAPDVTSLLTSFIPSKGWVSAAGGPRSGRSRGWNSARELREFVFSGGLLWRTGRTGITKQPRVGSAPTHVSVPGVNAVAVTAVPAPEAQTSDAGLPVNDEVNGGEAEF